MANKREIVGLHQRRIRKRRRMRTCCTYPTAVPRSSILNQRNRSGVILVPLFFCFLFLQEVWLPFMPPCYPLCVFMLYGVLYMQWYVWFCLSCVWARFCPALRAATLQWAAIQQTGFGIMPSGPLVSYCACTLEASAYRQGQKTLPVTYFLLNKSSQ